MNNEKTAPRSNIRRETVKFYCTERGWRITAVAKAVSVMDSSGEKLTLERQNGFDVRTLAEHELKAILTVFDYKDLDLSLVFAIVEQLEQKCSKKKLKRRIRKLGIPPPEETKKSSVSPFVEKLETRDQESIDQLDPHYATALEILANMNRHIAGSAVLFGKIIVRYNRSDTNPWTVSSRHDDWRHDDWTNTYSDAKAMIDEIVREGWLV